MKLAVFGSSGFIGRNLSNYLEINHDITHISLRSIDWQNIFSDQDVFINLIGKAHDHKGTVDEQDYYYVNVELLKDIYQEFILSKAELLIHVSSLAAVEEIESNEFLTEQAPCNPSSFYGKSKRAAEEWILSQPMPKGKKVIIIRPPMVHGPGDKGNLVLLYKLISNGIPYPLSSFENNRSFISIDNFSFFIEKIINGRDLLKSGIYHIADDEPISTLDIIKTIECVLKKNIPNFALPKFIVKGIAKMGDIFPIPLNTKRLKKMTSNLLVSNIKIKKDLGIEKLPLSAKEGLEITIKSFNQS